MTSKDFLPGDMWAVGWILLQILSGYKVAWIQDGDSKSKMANCSSSQFWNLAGGARAGASGRSARRSDSGRSARRSDRFHRRRGLRLRGGGWRQRRCGRARGRNRRRAPARFGEVVQQSKNRRGLPCDERAELHDGRPHGGDRLGNYSVGPPEAPSGFVPSCHHAECGQDFRLRWCALPCSSNDSEKRS